MSAETGLVLFQVLFQTVFSKGIRFMSIGFAFFRLCLKNFILNRCDLKFQRKDQSERGNQKTCFKETGKLQKRTMRKNGNFKSNRQTVNREPAYLYRLDLSFPVLFLSCLYFVSKETKTRFGFVTERP